MRFTLFAFASLFVIACTSEAPPYVGVFSNDAEGFYVKRLILIEEGKCLYQGIPANWKRDPQTEEFTITFPKDAELEFYEFKLRFDPIKREFTILDPKIAEGTRPMHLTPIAIPHKVRTMLKRFDGTWKSYHE